MLFLPLGIIIGSQGRLLIFTRYLDNDPKQIVFSAPVLIAKLIIAAIAGGNGPKTIEAQPVLD